MHITYKIVQPLRIVFRPAMLEDMCRESGDWRNGYVVRNGNSDFWACPKQALNTIRKAHAVRPISALQSEYSLRKRNLEADILLVLREFDISLLAFGPRGRGFLMRVAKPTEAYPPSDFSKTKSGGNQGFVGYRLNESARLCLSTHRRARYREEK